jgi:kynurenine formamidase
MFNDSSRFAHFVVAATLALVPAAPSSAADASPTASHRFEDLSLPIASDLPCTWPAAPMPRFQLIRERTIGPASAFNVDVLVIDGNTSTQWDVPPHSVARPDLKREKSGPFGLAFTETIAPWQFGGEACVVDVQDLLDQAPDGVSPLVRRDRVAQFEQAHRAVGFGDVVLFRSGYSDKYFRPLPAGSRYIADVLDRKAPGYPNPDPDCMDYLGSRGVMILGTDSPSMGPLPDLAEPTHYAGLKYGMVWTEGATRLAALPPTGAFYCMLCPKHADGAYSEGRALAIVGGELPQRLIDAARNKRAIDLTPTMRPGMPLTSPGTDSGVHRQVYLKVDFQYVEYLDMWHHTHVMDAMTGAHLVPPAYALPAGRLPEPLAPHVREWLAEYEQRYGPRGESDRTTDKVPLDWTCGRLRAVDVRDLVGSTDPRDWPASPEITPAHLERFEQREGPLEPGDVVAFLTGHVDKHLADQPQGVWSDPLRGKSEGWPAPGPDAILYLQSKGVRCVATDAPDLGGVDPRRALMTYWALGSRDMVGVEFLCNLPSAPQKSYFLFAALKIVGCHGGPGRAIVFYD